MKDDLESNIRVDLIYTNVEMTGLKYSYSKFLQKNNFLAGRKRKLIILLNCKIANIFTSNELSFMDNDYKDLS